MVINTTTTEGQISLQIQIIIGFEARIQKACGVSVCRTHGHADKRRICVQYATCCIVDEIVGQKLWIRLGHG